MSRKATCIADPSSPSIKVVTATKSSSEADRNVAVGSQDVLYPESATNDAATEGRMHWLLAFHAVLGMCLIVDILAAAFLVLTTKWRWVVAPDSELAWLSTYRAIEWYLDVKHPERAQIAFNAALWGALCLVALAWRIGDAIATPLPRRARYVLVDFSCGGAAHEEGCLSSQILGFVTLAAAALQLKTIVYLGF